MKLTIYIQDSKGKWIPHPVTRISKADNDWIISYTVIKGGMRETRKIKLSEQMETRLEITNWE